MWTGRRGTADGCADCPLDAASDRDARAAAAGHGGAHAAARAAAQAVEGRGGRGFVPAGAVRIAGAAALDADRGRRSGSGHLHAFQLARALRHRAGAGPPLGHDAGADFAAGAGGGALFVGALAQGGGVFPPAVPVAGDGLVGGFSHGRLVQPVCFLRDHAHGLLRPAAAWLQPGAGARGAALHRRQSDGFHAVSHRHCHALWRDGHAEPG